MADDLADPSSTDAFADVWAANAAFAADFPLAGLSGTASKGLALVTCMDTRIDPLPVLGLEPGEAKIIRTAGARVTDDVLRSLVLATNLLGARRVLVVAHTDCGLVGSDDGVRAKVAERPRATGRRPGGGRLPAPGHRIAVGGAGRRRGAHPRPPAGPPGARSWGRAVYDVATGRLDPVEV